jgi:hypothetical protein
MAAPGVESPVHVAFGEKLVATRRGDENTEEGLVKGDSDMTQALVRVVESVG